MSTTPPPIVPRRWYFALAGQPWREIPELEAYGFLCEMERYPVFCDGFKLASVKH